MIVSRPGTKARRGRVSRRQNAKWRMRRVGPRLAARPVWLARAVFRNRCRCGWAPARCQLHRERVVLRRSLGGMRMAFNMPVAAFNGVSLLLMPGERGAADTLAVTLKHSDPALTLPLFVTSQLHEALAEWRAWSDVLGMPRLLAGQGPPSVSIAHPGQLHTGRPRPRRRRRSALKARRPSILLRRGFGKITRATPVHRGEREIIARN
jgi:hypothetical protein